MHTYIQLLTMKLDECQNKFSILEIERHTMDGCLFFPFFLLFFFFSPFIHHSHHSNTHNNQPNKQSTNQTRTQHTQHTQHTYDKANSEFPTHNLEPNTKVRCDSCWSTETGIVVATPLRAWATPPGRVGALIFPAIAINHAAILLAIDIRGDLQVYRGTVLVVEAVEGRVVSVLILRTFDLDR